ncbi:hypothetical protein I4U23_016896 [Adineta vaga]|nr:hypothetical protein I4U23_016896 [Adineta vaga]
MRLSLIFCFYYYITICITCTLEQTIGREYNQKNYQTNSSPIDQFILDSKLLCISQCINQISKCSIVIFDRLGSVPCKLYNEPFVAGNLIGSSSGIVVDLNRFDTNEVTTVGTTTSTVSSIYIFFVLSQVIDGRTVTCSSVDNSNASYTECTNLQEGGLYFPNGVGCGQWSSSSSSSWSTTEFCRKLTGSSNATIYAYYDCDSSQTRVVWNSNTWSTNNDNGYTKILRCLY